MSAVHVDYSVLSALQEVMEDEYLTLIDVFLNDSDSRIALLRQTVSGHASGLASLDLVELGLAAHSFKGSSSNMGAPRLSDLCRQLEDLARRQQPAGVCELVGLIDTEYQAIRRVFDSERQALIAQA